MVLTVCTPPSPFPPPPSPLPLHTISILHTFDTGKKVLVARRLTRLVGSFISLVESIRVNSVCYMEHAQRCCPSWRALELGYMASCLPYKHSLRSCPRQVFSIALNRATCLRASRALFKRICPCPSRLLFKRACPRGFHSECLIFSCIS